MEIWIATIYNKNMVKYYSQKDPRWANQKLGTCRDTLRQSGCKDSTIAMLMGDKKIKDPKGRMRTCTPAILDWVLTVNKVYTNGCLISDEKIAEFLGLEFNGRSTTQPEYPTMAETDHYKRYGVRQHFFLIFPNGDMVDPLDADPKPRKNKYHIVSYRLYVPAGWRKTSVQPKTQDVHSDDQSNEIKELKATIERRNKTLDKIHELSKKA